MRRMLLLILLSAFTSGLVGCDSSDNLVGPTGALTVFVQGTAVGGTGTIRCQDNSFVQDENASIVSVRFELYDADGERAETRSASPRGTVAFSGLAPGVYRIDQFVTASDSRDYGPASYTEIEVL